ELLLRNGPGWRGDFQVELATSDEGCSAASGITALVEYHAQVVVSLRIVGITLCGFTKQMFRFVELACFEIGPTDQERVHGIRIGRRGEALTDGLGLGVLAHSEKRVELEKERVGEFFVVFDEIEGVLT